MGKYSAIHSLLNNQRSQFKPTCTSNLPWQQAYSPATQNFTLNPDEADGNAYDFHYSTSNLVLRSGYTMLVYIINPDSITINDIGLTVSVTLYTAQAMYYRECNVQAYTPISQIII